MSFKLSFNTLIFILLTSCFCSCSSSRFANKSVAKNSYSKEEMKYISNGTKDQPMRVFLTTNESDSLLLRKKSQYIHPAPNDKILTLFIDRLLSTVQDSMSLGVGIAAPQVGVLKNIIWVQRFDKEGFPFEVYLNPNIIQYTDKKQPCPEGCLSIPNKKATNQNRAYAILLEYDTPIGEHKVEMIEDFTAVIFQHEIDHLNGILFTDYIGGSLKD